MIRKALSILALAAVTTLAPAGIAQASQHGTASATHSPNPQPADHNGYCAFSMSQTSVWGWCDGTGPQRYQIIAHCSNGGVYGSSIKPWFGDQNGATAYCPSGTTATGTGWRRV